MRKMRFALCAIVLALLIALLPHARDLLPVDTRPLVEEKYAGWNGVLRLWVCERWPCGTGSLAAWLNHCVAGFEKRHNGVYIQAQFVDAGAVASMNDDGILPPDMLLFPSGLLTSAKGLAPLTPPEGLRAPLADCGSCDGALFAVPVAIGGYLWARNAALLDRVPDTWRADDVTLAVPTPEPLPGRRWDAALLALSSGSTTNSESSQAPISAAGGIDFGLMLDDTPAPPSTLAPQSPETPCQLPADFQYDDDAWRRFLNGNAAAMPVSQWEIRRLQALAEQGRGPDWQLERGVNAFTDQLMNLAIVQHADGDARPELCVEFMKYLLSDVCQSALSRAAAFSVTDAPSGYAPSDPLALMEASLRDSRLRVPNCFNARWPQAAESLVQTCVYQSGDLRPLWSELCKYLH